MFLLFDCKTNCHPPWLNFRSIGDQEPERQHPCIPDFPIENDHINKLAENLIQQCFYGFDDFFHVADSYLYLKIS